MRQKDILIPVTIGGVTFKNPFFVASGPTTKTVRQLKRIEETGWAAASIKLSIDPAPYINRKPRYAVFEDTNALAFTAEKRLTFEQGLTLVREAKKVLTDLKLFANITYAGEAGAAGWVNMAKKFEEAGADIIELNMCCPNMSYNVSLTSGGNQQASKQTGASLGQQREVVAEIVRAIKKEIHIPLFVKLTPEGGQIAHVAEALYEAGADAVGGTGNRLGIPDIDLEHPEKAVYHLQDEISMSCYCGSWLKPLAQRDTYEIRKVCGKDAKIMAAGGITNWKDAVEMVLCGGNLLGVCAETLISGYDIVRPMIQGMKEYMDRHGYQNLEDFCGKIVPEVRTAPELTLYDGYAHIKEPRLSGPCKAACPLHVPVQAYVQEIAQGKFREAYERILRQGALQGACAYVCSHPCEDACVRGDQGDPVRIRELKRFVLELGRSKGWTVPEKKPASNGLKAAVIGSGPRGLTCAEALADAGYAVTIFEKDTEPGGALRLLVSGGRLPEAVWKQIRQGAEAKGITLQTGCAVTPEELRQQGFDAVAQAADPKERPEADGYALLETAEDLKQKKVVIYGRSLAVFDMALAAKRAGADVRIAGGRWNEKQRGLQDLLRQMKQEGIPVTGGLEFETLTQTQAVFRGPAGETVTLACDRFYRGENISKSASIPAAAAKGLELAARIDHELRGAEATLQAPEGCVPVKKEAVLRRSGYIGDTRQAAALIQTEAEAMQEAGRCLKCGCGEGCQLCKTICTDFAPYIAGEDCLAIDPLECVACGMCFNRCPNRNIEMINKGQKV